MTTTAEGYFDRIARDYDYWKKKNYYYHDTLKKLCQSYVKSGDSVLEIGCGTGDILASLTLAQGFGVDISGGMIAEAQQKYASRGDLRFERADITTWQEVTPYDIIILVDVLEHIDNTSTFVEHIARIAKPDSKIIITLANPLWEPVLVAAEKLGLKMPEGPHARLSIEDTETLFRKSGYRAIEQGYRLLIPKRLPTADWINAHFYTKKFLARFGFIVYWVLAKDHG